MYEQYIAVAVHMPEKVLTGFISLPPRTRLSDYLNGDPTGQSSRPCRFLELTAVTIFHADGTKERPDTIYINTEAIQMLRTRKKDSARGIGASYGAKQSPFIIKIPLRAAMRLPSYEIDGYLHCRDVPGVTQLLAEDLTFLPCTDARIHNIDEDLWWDAGFVAINRKHIHSFEQYH